MRRGTALGWTILALVLLVGCAGEAADPTTDTTRALLGQARAEDLSTPVDSERIAVGEPTLDVDRLGVNVGSVEAPVKVIEFVDYGCGYCRQFQIETFPTVRAEFIETQMVEWKFMPFISGMFANSPQVTEAAECALDQHPRLFGAFSDLLWARQREWKGSDEPAELVREWIGQLGADVEAFDRCLEEDVRLERVRSATALASQLGIRSTPTFWILGLGAVQGALPADAFREVLTEVHAQMTRDAG